MKCGGRLTWASVVLAVLLAGGTAPAQDAPPPTTRAAESRPASAPASQPGANLSPEQCRAAFLKGDYAAAADGYRGLLAGLGPRVPAAVGLAEALAAEGKYDQAAEALDRVADQAGADAAWHVARAELFAVVGQYDRALDHARQAVRLRPDWMPAIAALGAAQETLGRREDAAATYRSAEDVFASDACRKDPRSLVAAGLVLDRYGVLTARRASEQGQNILRNYLQEAYQKLDRTYWPAHVAAGMFLLAKHRPQQAAKEFELAAALNPRIADVHVGQGILALEAWDFEQCLGKADAALAINPNSVDARMLRAVCLMQWRKFEQVPAELDAILRINPNHLEALSLYAALRVRQGRADEASPFAARVEKINPSCAALPAAIGQWLSAGRQFDEARRQLLRAVELEPNLAGPLAELGLLYLQTGQEDQARETLRKAHALDDYRQDVVNYLRLLDRLEKFLVRRTEHFIVKVDAKRDAVLLDQVSEYLEKIHGEVCGDFDHAPAEPTLVEIFPTHEEFSVRVSGRGWIGTVGASTGRVIALVAPTPEERRNPFGTHNWATVLRHEYAHTVTLSATGNRIPHWFTEACAVWEQPDRRNYQAVQQLTEAVRTGRLFPVRELDWGFIRPRRGGDRGLAYAQSEWMLEYIIRRRSYSAVPKMLQSFRDGRSQAEAFRDVLGVSEEQFDKDFRAWAREQVREWGFDPDPPKDLIAAELAAKLQPLDAGAQADYAVALYLRGKTAEADQAAQKALALDADNTGALAVRALTAMARDELDQAVRHAERLERLDHAGHVAPRVLARCALKKRQYARAIAALELFKQRRPLDEFSYKELAALYVQLGQPEKALPNLLELHRRTMTDQKYARQAADIYRMLDKPDQALEYYRQVLHINPYETSAYEAVAAIHRDAGRFDPAIQAVRNVCLLEPDSDQSWIQLAMMRYLAGREPRDDEQLRQARQDAEKALKLNPSGQAQKVLDLIDQALAP
ncbi:MAG TPA: hypothetical protein DCX07_12835 [Phycisphaerales bacterium]|nr:hypothetical protein [Phycisphaerales bacterium]